MAIVPRRRVVNSNPAAWSLGNEKSVVLSPSSGNSSRQPQLRATTGRRYELAITDYVNPRISDVQHRCPAAMSIDVERARLEEGSSWSLYAPRLSMAAWSRCAAASARAAKRGSLIRS